MYATEYAPKLKEHLTRTCLFIYVLREQQVLPLRLADSGDELLFQLGDLALVSQKLKKRGMNLKLQSKFDGPSLVKKAFPNGTCKVEGRGTVNECSLKLFAPCSNVEGQPRRPKTNA